MPTTKIKIIALMGKAGSGKDTLMQKVLAAYPDRFNEIISCTTRPAREHEINGKNYYFLTIEEFTKRLLQGDLLEATEFNDWHYGTLFSTLAQDKPNIGVFNPEGVFNLIDNPSIDLEVWYIQASDKDRLLRQLNREVSPNVAEIIRRYKADEEDFAEEELEDLDYTIFYNNDAEDIKLFVTMFGRLY